MNSNGQPDHIVRHIHPHSRGRREQEWNMPDRLVLFDISRESYPELAVIIVIRDSMLIRKVHRERIFVTEIDESFAGQIDVLIWSHMADMSCGWIPLSNRVTFNELVNPFPAGAGNPGGL